MPYSAARNRFYPTFREEPWRLTQVFARRKSEEVIAEFDSGANPGPLISAAVVRPTTDDSLVKAGSCSDGPATLFAISPDGVLIQDGLMPTSGPPRSQSNWIPW